MRKVAVVTGTRADFGLLYPTLCKLRDDSEIELHLVVAAAHWSRELGETWREIEACGFQIAAKVDNLLASDSAFAVARSSGLGLIGFANAFESLQPDIVLVLGDRYEILSAAQAAALARIPIAHLHGGEVTHGAIDDVLRHCITKLSDVHFAATDGYRQRIMQLGEQPERIYVVGATGTEVARSTDLIGRTELESDLGIQLSGPLLLVTYHPATRADIPPQTALQSLFTALDVVHESAPDCRVVFTYPNADTGGRSLIPLINDFNSARPDWVRTSASLGRRRYLSVMALASAVIGNSSSGIIEAPAMGVPTVNVGSRQDGRTKPESVIDCSVDINAIAGAIKTALQADTQARAKTQDNPYDQGNCSGKVVEVLKNIDLAVLRNKKFVDIQIVDDP